jgi:hypothetical protein
METIKDYVQSIPFIGWIMIIFGIYLSLGLHKVIRILKEMRS